MKLLVVLSVIACGYAAKLDRTYLPPASAASAGGSPGSLNAPSVQSRPSEGQEFGQTHGSNAGFLNAPLAASRPSEGRPGYAQPEAIKSSNAAFGNEYQAPSGQFNQPGAPNFDSGFKQPAQSFGNQAQNYQRNQPERARASEDRNAQILRTDSQNDGETFSYNFETSNGIAAEESGVATNGVQAQGVFSYSDDDGQTYRVAYTADENGYQPQGDHLPTPHPIPEEILKSIEENTRAAASGTQEGAYNPEEDNKPVRAQQQYNSDAPTSYGQAPTGPSGAFNQPGKAPEPYTAPSFGALSRPQESQGNAQGPSQLYNTPEFQATPGFRRRQPNSPSKLYGAPSANNARPNQFQEASGRDSSNNFAPVAPSFGSSASSQGRPSQHQAPPSNTFGRTQGFPQGQESDESGYQYNRPQGSAFSRIPSANQGQFNSPAIAQPSRVQNFRPGPSQGSFGSNGAQASRPQGFGAQGPQSSFGAARSPSGPSDQGVPSFPTGSFGVLSQPSYGPPSPAKPSQPSKFPQHGPAFGPSNGQNLQKSQGHSQGAGMSDGYEYNRPSSHGSVQRPQIGLNVARNVNGPRGGHSGAQNGFNAAQNGFGNVQSAPQQRGQSFGGPRQPPSFNENEGYKY